MSNRTLARYGPARGGIRVYEDAARQLVRVSWRETGRTRYQSFPLTAEGRAEAKAFGRGVWAKQSAPVAPPSPTVRELWGLYAEAEYPHLRPRTRVLYASRWRLFERFIAHDTPASDIGALSLDRFAAAMRAQRYAPNQVAEHIRQVKIVFSWAKSRHLLPATEVPGYRFKLAKSERKQQPAEYLPADYERLQARLSPQSAPEWRASALLLFLANQGVRENAALHLRWSDIRDGWIHWPAEWDKTGREDFVQPLRIGAVAALLTAQDWREREGYTGPWVFPAARAARRARGEPYSAQGFAYVLAQVERRAGVAHLELRGAHGLRRMVVGDVAAETGDAWLALQFVGDRDPGLIPTYVKQRLERLEGAAERMDRVATASRECSPSASRVPGYDAKSLSRKSHRSDLNRRPPASGSGSQCPKSRLDTELPAGKPHADTIGPARTHPESASRVHPDDGPRPPRSRR